MALNSPPLARPAYLQGVTIENAEDYKTRCALHVFEHGRLSTVPCDLCVEDDADCIVARSRASRCMRCVYIDKSVLECQAEGVRAIQRSDTQVQCQSVFPVETNPATHNAATPQSNTERLAPTKQKRKRRVSDPADAIELAAKRLRSSTRRPAVTEQTYAPIAPKLTGQASATTTTTTTTNCATVTEHPYAPTAPRATATAYASDPISVASTTLATQDLSTVRLAPFGSKEYDLAIRTQDRVAWAQWANDLHKEIRSLRYVQDLGAYTMGVIAMMTEDGVWPTGNEVDLTEAEG